MSFFATDSAFARVLSFTFRLWLRLRGLAVTIFLLMLASIAADIAIPVVTGRLVAALSLIHI